MRRLFSTFARGWPGAGLLLMRVIAGLGLAGPAALRLVGPGTVDVKSASAILLATGVLVTAGLWTPLAGTALAVLELWQAIAEPGDRWGHVLAATIGGALAMVGPGLWSLDALFFGWRRIEPPVRHVSAQWSAGLDRSNKPS